MRFSPFTNNDTLSENTSEKQDVQVVEKLGQEETNKETIPVIAKGYWEEAFDAYKHFWNLPKPQEEETIKFNQSLSIAAFFYERARSVVDNKSDHLLRRNAVERIIRRLIWENPRMENEKLALSLARELIWGRYLSNGSITNKQIHEVALAMNKYFLLLSSVEVENKNQLESRKNLIYGALSTEIEQIFDPSLFYIGLWNGIMYRWFKDRFELVGEDSEEIKNDLIFIAIHRALTKSDDARISYYMLVWKLPNWKGAVEPSRDLLSEASTILEKLEQLTTNQKLNKLFRLIRRQTPPFLILRDFMEKKKEQVEKIVAKQDELFSSIIKLCNDRYRETGDRVRSGIIRSIIYIFVTKVFIILAIEIPYELFFVQHLDLFPLIINLLTPPVLMVLVGITIQTPDNKNTKRIIDEVNRIVFKGKIEKIAFSIKSEKNVSGDYFFKSVYFLLFVISFSFIIFILSLLSFNVVGMIMFFFFLSLVMLFGFRVQFTAADLQMEAEKKGIILRLVEHLSLPFLNLGVILSRGIGRLNFITVFMDILIEMPLKTVVEIAGEWSNYIKERRAEIVEVPVN